MKKSFLILTFLFLFLQGCMVWPMLTGATGLAVNKKKEVLAFFCRLDLHKVR